MRRREKQSAAFRDALRVSRCVGHAQTTPLRPEDVEGLARFIDVRTLAAGEPVQRAGEVPDAVCIVREGCLELAVHGARRARADGCAARRAWLRATRSRASTAGGRPRAGRGCRGLGEAEPGGPSARMNARWLSVPSS